jgi:two-component system chemotaxis response regulator CheB
VSIRVYVVDDSAVVRQTLTELLSAAPDIEVLGASPDPIFARQRMQQQWPDVITLDMEMPRMDGLTFLRQLMQERPTPVIVCSSLTEQGASLTLQALEAGAFDIITKPQGGVKAFLTESRERLLASVRAAAGANLQALRTEPRVSPSGAAPEPPVKRSSHIAELAHTTDRITVIGTSTGGTQALEAVLTALPATCPGIAIVQHMPEQFTRAFARRLDAICALDVKEAESGDRLLPGRALIAPGGHHLEVHRSGAQYIAQVFRGPAVNRHCPSVDVLFRSAAKYVGRNACGVLMTGMGDDGARGLLAMREAGARTLAQDEKTSVVFGMPREAIKLGAAMEILPLGEIAGKISS